MKTGISARHGFTLVELLVVIAIIGVLVALLLPAIQAAREAGRRSQCSNNLKQMGLALHAYHDVHQAFPMGIQGHPISLSEQGLGWAYELLPYAEEQSLYDSMNNQILPAWRPAVCRRAYQATGNILSGGDTIVAVYRCPTSEMESHATDESLPAYAQGYSTSDYKGCNGSDTSDSVAAGSDTIGIFNTVRELWDVAKRKKLAIKDVTDGLNKTIAIGESAYFKEPEFEKWPFWIGGVVQDESTLFKTNESNPINGAISSKSVANFNQATDDECAFSWHIGGVFFAFADGSVHFLSESLDLVTYRNLGNIADGNVVSDFR